jgi:hypothetical protein
MEGREREEGEKNKKDQRKEKESNEIEKDEKMERGRQSFVLSSCILPSVISMVNSCSVWAPRSIGVLQQMLQPTWTVL